MALDRRLNASIAQWSGTSAEAEFYGQFVCAAYTMGDTSPANPPPEPPLPAGYELVADIYMTDFVFEPDTSPTHYGLLAANNAGHHVLAIRGTVGWKEWWADLTSLRLVDCVFTNSTTVFGQVGYGFLEIYKTLKPIARAIQPPTDRMMALEAVRSTSFATALHAIIETHAAKRGTLAVAPPTVDITGHSLGAALVTLYTLDRQTGADRYPAKRICTFASPMVGNAAFKTAFETNFLEGQADRSWRFYISSDIVPDVPPAILGFVPVDDGIELKLGWDTRWWWAPCSHSLSSYLHVLDPTWPLPSACTGSSANDRCTPPSNVPVA